MSTLTCVSCRDVVCSVAVGCNELDSGRLTPWLHTFAIKDRLFLVVSQVSSPSLSSIADDVKLKVMFNHFWLPC